MKSTEAVLTFAKWLKEGVLEGDGSGRFSGEHQQGYYYGIEVIIAYMEERPALFRNMDKEAMKTDLQRFPEYFI